jgi:hypothetical protein
LLLAPVLFLLLQNKFLIRQALGIAMVFLPRWKVAGCAAALPRQTRAAVTGIARFLAAVNTDPGPRFGRIGGTLHHNYCTANDQPWHARPERLLTSLETGCYRDSNNRTASGCRRILER